MGRMTLAKVLLRQEKEFLVEENFYTERNELARSLLSQGKNLWWSKSIYGFNLFFFLPK